MACCGLFTRDLRRKCIVVGSILTILDSGRLYLYNQSFFTSLYYINKFGYIKESYRLLLWAWIASGVARILKYLFVLLFIFGLIKNKRGYLKAFITPTVICYVIDTILYLILWFYAGHRSDPIYSYYVFLYAYDFVIRLLTPYFIMIVHDYYVNIKEGDPRMTYTFNDGKLTKGDLANHPSSDDEEIFPEDSPNTSYKGNRGTEQHYIHSVVRSGNNMEKLPETYFPSVYHSASKEFNANKSYTIIV